MIEARVFASLSFYHAKHRYIIYFENRYIIIKMRAFVCLLEIETCKNKIKYRTMYNISKIEHSL